MVVEGKWSLFGGGRELRFDYEYFPCLKLAKLTTEQSFSIILHNVRFYRIDAFSLVSLFKLVCHH